MPFNGSGTYNLPPSYNPVVTGTLVSSTAFNATMGDVAAAFDNCVTRDGQGVISGDFQMDGFKLVNLGNGTAATPALYWTAGDGLFRSTTHVINFAINSASVATVDANGFNGALGGTTPADAKVTTLEASGTATLSGGLQVSGANFTIGANVHLTMIRNGESTGQNSLDFTTAGSSHAWQVFQQSGTFDLGFYSATSGMSTVMEEATGNVDFLKGVSVGQTLAVAGLATLQSVTIESQFQINNNAGGGYGGLFEITGPNGNKFVRINPVGDLEFINSAGSAVIMTLKDNGDLYVTGIVHAAGFAS